jgi:hypothetical protein
MISPVIKPNASRTRITTPESLESNIDPVQAVAYILCIFPAASLVKALPFPISILTVEHDDYSLSHDSLSPK